MLNLHCQRAAIYFRDILKNAIADRIQIRKKESIRRINKKHDYKEAMNGSLILNCMRRKYISFTVSRLALYTALLFEKGECAIRNNVFERGQSVLLAVKKVTDVVR
jgi:hypothetical protein